MTNPSGVRIITSMETLSSLARRAAETKDPEDIRKHKEYEAMCLRADEILIGRPLGSPS